jgi:hypothetical protein
MKDADPSDESRSPENKRGTRGSATEIDFATRMRLSPFFLIVAWADPTMWTMGEFAERTELMLSRLRAADPVFGRLFLRGKNRKDSPLLADDLSNLRPWIFKRSWMRNPSTNSPYSHPGPRGALTALSTGRMGFHIDLSNLEPPARRLTLGIGGGGARGGGVDLTPPPDCVDDFRHPEFLKRLVGIVGEVWPVRYATSSQVAWAEGVDLPWPARNGMLPIGGLTYCSDGTIVEALPPGVAWEPMGSGGILIKITERPDELDPQAIATAIAVRDSLAAHGMLKVAEPVAT